MDNDELARIPDEYKKILNDYKIPDDLKEVVKRIAKDSEDMDLRLSEFKFIYSSKMLGVAVGGAAFVLGILFILTAIFLFFNLFDLTFSEKIRLAISSISFVVGVVQLLAGTLLIGK